MQLISELLLILLFYFTWACVWATAVQYANGCGEGVRSRSANRKTVLLFEALDKTVENFVSNIKPLQPMYILCGQLGLCYILCACVYVQLLIIVCRPICDHTVWEWTRHYHMTSSEK